MNAIVNQGGEGALVAWDPNSGAALPAYLADALGELGSNIADRQTVPSLSYEGKTWSIHKDGNKTKLQMVNGDGDTVPVPVMRAVVLNFNGDRGRSYYEGTYNPAASTAPKCWSPDGKAPDASVKEKMSATCNGCPMSVKGSKVQDGKEMVACSSHRMLAVAPAFEIDGDPLRLKIAVTSDYDKEIVEHGWYAFRQYVDYLKSRGVAHTALVVTKIKFDSTVAYPKLLFALDRPLTPEEVAKVKGALANPKVAELLAEKWSAAGANGTDKSDSDIKPFGLEGAYADGWQAHPDSAGWSWKGAEVIANAELAARYPEPKAPPAPVEAAPPVPAAEQVIEQKPAPAPEPVREAAVAATVAPKPTDASHIAHAGTDNELWWSGTEWVKPWDTAPKHDTAPPPPPAPPAPPAAPVEAPKPEKTPREMALEAGWVQHPDSEPHGYLGAEVLDWAAIEAKFAPGKSAPPATPAGGDQGSAAGAASTTTTATTNASPSDIPADVAELLNKWA